ncbi:signal peptidase I [Actinoplanes bogorensis]|uniref:Signal peptidase I n=1 Tax=Paractinoplanes bogorensis TaxID=1610840 RepID=A0ABS5YSA4_9ACTN|nr:signal peptidase I [Actinoplanes bogorensis]MBU2666329.1 signal peptidase I [Actinoplanes bogorensis]
MLLFDARDAALACIVGLLLVSMAPVLLGWKSTVVVSGSMMPRIRPGDVISAAAPPPTHVEVGTVVLVNDPAHPGELLMHRVIRLDEAGRMITKGDANPTADSTPVPMDHLVGIPRIRIPYIGLPYLWIRQGRYVPVVAAAILLLTLLLWQPRRNEPPTPPPSAPRRLSDGPVDADPYRVRRVPVAHGVLDGPVDADSYRLRRAPIGNSAALIRDSMAPAPRPNWIPETAAAVSMGDR